MLHGLVELALFTGSHCRSWVNDAQLTLLPQDRESVEFFAIEVQGAEFAEIVLQALHVRGKLLDVFEEILHAGATGEFDEGILGRIGLARVPMPSGFDQAVATARRVKTRQTFVQVFRVQAQSDLVQGLAFSFAHFGHVASSVERIYRGVDRVYGTSVPKNAVTEMVSLKCCHQNAVTEMVSLNALEREVEAADAVTKHRGVGERTD
jgi:hypothetical protein